MNVHEATISPHHKDEHPDDFRYRGVRGQEGDGATISLTA